MTDKKSKTEDTADRNVILSAVDGKVIRDSRNDVSSVYALDVIAEHERTAAEDLLGRISFGGEVSMLLDAEEECGFSVAHLKNHRLFSVPVAEITLYKNKAEYRADSNGMHEKYGKVFGFVRDMSLDTVMQLDKTDDGDTVKDVFDIPALLSAVSECISRGDGYPFSVTVDVGETSLAVCEDPEKLCGALISAIVAGIKLSSDGHCAAVFRSDGEHGELIVSCRVDHGCTVDFRGFDLSRFAELSPVGHTEILLLDFFAETLGWDAEIDETQKGDFCLTLRIDGQTDPDRLKFRECACDIEAGITRCFEYLTNLSI